MNVDQVILDDIPRHLNHADYDYAKQTFASMCHYVGVDPKHYGYFGSISCPGISDIDALAIGSASQLQKLHNLFLQQQQTDSDFVAMFWHPPVYLLNSIIPYVFYLHTLDGLNESTSLLLQQQASNNEEHRYLLNVIWFTFLIRTCNSMFRSSVISLRKLLLVYKNLEFSQIFFNSFVDTSSIDIISSDELRKIAFKKSFNDKFFLEAFCKKFLSTLRLFDLYCAFWESNYISHRQNSRVLLVDRNFMLTSSRRSKLNFYRRMTVFETNPVSYAIAEQFMFNGGYKNDLLDYVAVSWKVASEYRSAGLNYAFITPFSMGIYGRVYQVVRMINRLCKVGIK